MALDETRFREFLELSCHWTLRDQRYLSALGYELLVCDQAFSHLYAECQRLTDPEPTKWKIDEAVSSTLIVFARAFVDHAVRAQKLVKKYLPPSDTRGDFAEDFFGQNRELFGLRDAIHHIDTRIDSNEAFEHLQALNGDLSWIHLTSPHSFDMYWITPGTVAGGEWASPSFQTELSFRHPVDHIRYRAHGWEVDLGTAYLNVLDFLGRVHDFLKDVLEAQLTQQGLATNGESHPRLPRHISGRVRVGVSEEAADSEDE